MVTKNELFLSTFFSDFRRWSGVRRNGVTWGREFGYLRPSESGTGLVKVLGSPYCGESGSITENEYNVQSNYLFNRGLTFLRREQDPKFLQWSELSIKS